MGAVAYDDSKSGKEMANYDTGYFTKAATGIDATPISDNAAATYYDVQGSPSRCTAEGYKHREAQWQNNESTRKIKHKDGCKAIPIRKKSEKTDFVSFHSFFTLLHTKYRKALSLRLAN